MKISLETLLSRLVGRGNELARQMPAQSDERTPTSIRLSPTTKAFLTAQASALGTTPHALIGTILDGVAETTLDPTSARLRTMRERFFHLAEAHGLGLPELVDLMAPYGFTMSALGSTDRVLDLLTREAIAHLAEVFHVRPAWLSAGHDSAVENLDVQWYKDVHGFARRINAHMAAGRRPNVLMVRRSGADFDRAAADNDSEDSRREPVGFVLRLQRTTPGGAPFTTYQNWEFERWNYWRCREQLKLVVAYCEQVSVPVLGFELPADRLDALKSGSALPVTLMQRLGCASWFPDNYASFNFKVSQEAAEWYGNEIYGGVRETYLKSGLSDLAQSAGAKPLPEKPWQSTAAA